MEEQRGRGGGRREGKEEWGGYYLNLDTPLDTPLVLQENIKTLVGYIVEHFMSTLEAVEYVDTFKGLKLRNEQAMDAENEPPPAM